jgi:hypothetical protein
MANTKKTTAAVVAVVLVAAGAFWGLRHFPGGDENPAGVQTAREIADVESTDTDAAGEHEVYRDTESEEGIPAPDSAGGYGIDREAAPSDDGIPAPDSASGGTGPAPFARDAASPKGDDRTLPFERDATSPDGDAPAPFGFYAAPPNDGGDGYSAERQN